MIVRDAKIKDVKAIHSLISDYAQRDLMLFRSMTDIYENLQTFSVVEENGNIIGCSSLQIIWSDLAEIRSLAVNQDNLSRGVGTMLVSHAVEKACNLGIERVFALTLKPEFFQKAGFNVIDKQELPMKVWSDCAKCPKQDNCDEIAVIKNCCEQLL